MPRKNGFTRNCRKCGKEMYVQPYREKNKRGYFCSKECFDRWWNTARAHQKKIYTCVCGKEFTDYIVNHRKYCSSSCYYKGRGFNVGERSIMKKGYARIFLPSGERKLEHIHIAEKELGRKLEKNEVVHHINGNKTDNKPENLLVLDRKIHSKLEHEFSRLFLLEHYNEMKEITKEILDRAIATPDAFQGGFRVPQTRK